MKKDLSKEDANEMRPEYDFSQLKGRVRGKYAARYREGTNVILLDPDVMEAFPNAEAVNDALRLLMKTAKTAVSSRLARKRRVA